MAGDKSSTWFGHCDSYCPKCTLTAKVILLVSLCVLIVPTSPQRISQNDLEQADSLVQRPYLDIAQLRTLLRLLAQNRQQQHWRQLLLQQQELLSENRRLRTKQVRRMIQRQLLDRVPLALPRVDRSWRNEIMKKQKRNPCVNECLSGGMSFVRCQAMCH